MNTFLPLPDFKESAKILDNKREWKQVIEAHQIINILENRSSKYIHHPAILMWRGYTSALKNYANVFAEEWKNRGGRNEKLLPFVINSIVDLPPWFGKEKFHASHRSSLLRKNIEHYSQFNWIQEDLDYWWPSKQGYFYFIDGPYNNTQKDVIIEPLIKLAFDDGIYVTEGWSTFKFLKR